MAENKTQDVFFERITLGLVNTLEKRSGICDVKLTEKQPTDKAAINTWEQSSACLLPADMRQFYQTSNGLVLTWSLKLSGSKVAVGHMHVNSLEKLNRIGGLSTQNISTKPSLTDIEDSDDEEEKTSGEAISPPRFDHRGRIFEIDPCQGHGKVCLVYRKTKPGVPAQKAEIWFLDRALRWHCLADSFLNYYRLMLTHMGLPQWQYAFTDIGISPQAKQWYTLVCPTRLGSEPVDCTIVEGTPGNQVMPKPAASQLDANRVFKGKEKKKVTQSLQNVKKRNTLTSAKSQPNMPGRSASAHFQSKPGR